MTGYFYQDGDSEKEILREELLTGKAAKWANNFLDPKKEPRGQANPKLPSTQLRKFYLEVKEIEERIKNMPDPAEGFKRIRPLVKMMKSKVAYACPDSGRDRKIPTDFREYIEEMVDNVHDWKDFQGFALCFEAVVGFFYGLGGK